MGGCAGVVQEEGGGLPASSAGNRGAGGEGVPPDPDPDAAETGDHTRFPWLLGEADCLQARRHLKSAVIFKPHPSATRRDKGLPQGSSQSTHLNGMQEAEAGAVAARQAELSERQRELVSGLQKEHTVQARAMDHQALAATRIVRPSTSSVVLQTSPSLRCTLLPNCGQLCLFVILQLGRGVTKIVLFFVNFHNCAHAGRGKA
jgi:hypothetical protein